MNISVFGVTARTGAAVDSRGRVGYVRHSERKEGPCGVSNKQPALTGPGQGKGSLTRLLKGDKMKGSVYVLHFNVTHILVLFLFFVF